MVSMRLPLGFMFSSSPSESDSSPAEILRYGELSDPSFLLRDPLLGNELIPSSNISQSFLIGTLAEFSGMLKGNENDGSEELLTFPNHNFYNLGNNMLVCVMVKYTYIKVGVFLDGKTSLSHL